MTENKFCCMVLVNISCENVKDSPVLPLKYSWLKFLTNPNSFMKIYRYSLNLIFCFVYFLFCLFFVKIREILVITLASTCLKTYMHWRNRQNFTVRIFILTFSNWREVLILAIVTPEIYSMHFVLISVLINNSRL